MSWADFTWLPNGGLLNTSSGTAASVSGGANNDASATYAAVSGGWFDRTIPISDAGIDATDQFRIRFTASDLGEGSVVEAGVDGVMLISVTCDEDCAGNLNGDDEVSARGRLLGFASMLDPLIAERWPTESEAG